MDEDMMVILTIARWALIIMILLIFATNFLFNTSKERAEYTLFGVGLIPLMLSTYVGGSAYIISYALFHVLFLTAQLVNRHWEAVLRRG